MLSHIKTYLPVYPIRKLTQSTTCNSITYVNALFYIKNIKNKKRKRY